MDLTASQLCFLTSPKRALTVKKPFENADAERPFRGSMHV